MTKDLIERLEKLDGPPPSLEAGALASDLVVALFGRSYTEVQRVRCFLALSTNLSALGASLALVGEKLPGWAWSVGNRKFGGQAYLMHGPGGQMIEGFGATPALAVLIALLRALETK